MIRAKGGWMVPDNSLNCRLLPELLIQEASHLSAVPSLRMDKIRAERKITIIEASDLNLQSFRTVHGKVEDGDI